MASGGLLSIPEGLSPRLRSRSWSPEREKQVHHGRQQHDTACLMHRGKGDGDQVPKSTDTEQDLEICHGKCARSHPPRQRRQGCAEHRVPSRQKQCRSCEVGSRSLIVNSQRRAES